VADRPFDIHVFVCQNAREPGHPRGDCASKGAAAVHAALKQAFRDTQAAPGGTPAAPPSSLHIRVNKSGCLDRCETGISVVVYPAGTWHAHVTEADVPRIVAESMPE
jgi:(2Fe-2S) ferredoxin